MEEKERYINLSDRQVKDTQNNSQGFMSINSICKILNQQDKRTKELEEENKELEIKLDKCVTELVNAESLVSYLENENQQLKQQLHELSKE